MKHILYIFGILLYSFYSVSFAEVNITLNSDDSSIDISELVELRIDVAATENETIGEVQIAGIESFNVVGQSVSNSTRIINGNSSENYTLILTLKANNAGDYQLGPVTVGDVFSNTLDLEVTGADISIGGQQDVAVGNGVISGGGSVQNTQSNNQNEQEPKEIITDEELLLEYDTQESGTGEISGLMANTKMSPIDIQKTAIAIIFLIAAFLAYKLYNILKASPLLEQKPIPVTPIRTDYYDLLEKIEDIYLKAEKNIFYAQLSNLLRKYLDERISPGLSTKTLSQVRTTLQKNPELYRLYETMYYPEYNKEKDTPDQRLDILESLKQELQ